ncbi:MAG: ATP-binding protein [Bacteroidetes bacterium]|nr:ATP-binding protein [Bacteroidota bacterium]
MENQINIIQHKFEKIFPFYFVVNENLVVEACGESLKKLHNNIPNDNFNKTFTLVRPSIENISFEKLQNLQNNLVVIEFFENKKVKLRGQFEMLTNEKKLFFIGSPWLDSLETIVQNNLTLNDFANHDSLVDLLHVIKANEIATDDLKILLQTVHEQKKHLTAAYKTLDEQKFFYEEILNKIPADLVVFNSNHEYTFINPNAVKDSELRAWLIGKKDEDYAILKNKPFAQFSQRRLVFLDAKNSKSQKSFEEKILKPNGEEQWMLRIFFPVLNEKNEVDIIIGYGLDITSIKNIQKQIAQNEERYRDVIDNSLAVITTHNLKGEILSVNPMVSKVYGYETEELIGANIINFIPNDDRPTYLKYITDLLKYKQISGTIKLILKEETGKEPYVIGFAIDITERVNAEKELEFAKNASEKQAEAMQIFLANMSHEIRTPMNAIVGMGNLLSKTGLNSNQLFYSKTINTAAENLLKILNDILDLSKIKIGKLSIEKIAFDPKEVLARAMSVMMHKAEEKGIAFTNSFCDTRLSNVLIGDPFRLNQVLLNLVSNAIKFTEKGSVNIDFEVLNQYSKKQHIRITVSDTGIGMSKTFSKNLFQKFTQEDESTTRKYGGTGLGMSICRELVEMMNGKIYAESSKGVGSKFFVEIVLEKGSSDQLSSSSKIGNLDINISDSKILLADDNEVNRLVVTTILNHNGCIIDEAENGIEVLGKLKNNHYDVILMDIQMPLLDGIEATKKIRQSNINIPIIALTAFALKGDEEKFLSVGMNDYLVKPFKENDLLNIISKWLSQNKKSSAKVINTIKDTTITTPQNAKLYSLDTLKEISRGNEDFVKKMTTLFCDQTEIAVTEIKEHFANNELDKVSSLAHKIKPSLDNLKIDSLKTVIREIEKDAKENINNESIKKKIDILDEVISKVIVELRNS